LRREKGKRKFKRGIYILPSIFTSLSLFCGFYSITASIKENYLYASWAIILAAAFDAVDGRIARLIHSVSRFGEQYDSLVDVISFGIAPCVTLRLARFNVQSKSLENKYFQGLPSPSSAVMIATTVILFYNLGIVEIKNVTIPLLACLLAMLMVSTIRYHSFKDFDFKKRRPFSVLVALILLFILLIGEPEILLFTGAAIYTISGPVVFFFMMRKKRVQKKLLEEKEGYKNISKV